ncbi:MAG: hypothetical protein JWO89_3779 [Verrucomicrobiaceae bacterium]|nr:hypothetical protein [Verrucomicrobiaceae bacterium]
MICGTLDFIGMTEREYGFRFGRAAKALEATHALDQAHIRSSLKNGRTGRFARNIRRNGFH